MPAETEADHRLAESAQRRQSATDLLDDAAKAARIVGQIGDGRPVVFVGSGGLSRWFLCLLFFTDTTEVHVIEPERRVGSEALLGPALRRRQIEDVELVDHRLYGWKFVVVDQIKSESPIVR